MATTKSMSMSMSISSPLRLSGGSMPSSPTSPTSPPPPRSSSSTISQHSHTTSSMFSQPFLPKSSSSGGGGEENKFRFSKLLQLHHYHQNQNHQERQKRQEYGQEETTQQQRPSRHHHHQFFSSKHSETRFKERTHRSGFLRFLQSHYHVFHRHTDLTGKGVQGRERVLTDVSVPQSPGGSFLSTQSKSPQSTVHSAYNVTISDFRAHATIGSTRSGGSPKNVTDIVFERRAFDPMTSSRGTSVQDSDGQRNMISPPISSSVSSSSKGARSVNPTTPKDDLRDTGVFRSPFRSLGMLNLASSPSSSVSPLPSPSSTSTSPRPPPSPSFGTLARAYDVGPHERPTNTNMISPSSPRSPGHERCDQTGSVSSKTSSSKWGMSAKFAFINLKKKRSMLPSHYLSLPVGGSTSSANGLYMLHSEDLSVTEFAKLAGITILSEDDTNTRAQEELANGGEGDGQGQGQAGPGPGSVFDSGDTINSDRHLTFNSMASDSSFHRKINIWEPQFWTTPSRDGSTGTHTPLTSVSTTSLPIQTAPSTPRTSERRDSYRSENAPSLGSSRRASITPSSSGVLSSSVPVRAPPNGSKIGSHDTQTVGPSIQARRNSCSPGLTLASPGQDSDRSRPSSGSTKRDHAKSSKDVQFSRNLGRRRSFSSLTAIAIELDSDHELETRTQKSHAPDEPKSTLGPNLQNGHHPITDKTEATPDTSMEASNPPGGLLGILSPQPQPVASHSLQNSLRMRGHPPPFASSFRSTLPGNKTRSPSPSPLSRQISVSESVKEDQKEEAVSISSQGQDQESQDQAQDRGLGKGREGEEEEEGERQGYGQHMDTEIPTPLLLCNRTHSLPLLLSDPDHKSPSQAAVDPVARPPNSSPSRLLVPGMKVGRFTLVQEMCTKHVDILKAKEHELQVQRGSLDSQINGSSLSGQVFPSLKGDGSTPPSFSAERGPGESLEVSSDGSWSNPMLRPEENVMIFQRKKTRRPVPPSQLSRQDPL